VPRGLAHGAENGTRFVWHVLGIRRATRTVLRLPPHPLVYGDEGSGLVWVVVVGASGDGRPLGRVVVFSRSLRLCSGPLVRRTSDESVASCRMAATALSAGSHGDLVATYDPGASSSTSAPYAYVRSTSPARTTTVSKDRTATSIGFSPTTVALGDEAAAVFTVGISPQFGAGLPAGTAATIDVGSASCMAEVTGGTGTCSIADSALPAGSYDVSATFAGDADLDGSTATSSSELTVTG
jgi:hypothetical protein